MRGGLAICACQSRKNLETFLRSSAEDKTTVEKDGIWIVIGNEAHDLDSQSCSLAMSRLIDHKLALGSRKLVLPVMNVPRAEAGFRKDNLLALELAGLSNHDIIYVDEIPINDWAKKGCLKLVLCDHNELSPRQVNWSESVKQIYDHHRDVGKYADAERCIRFPTGSCSSIVLQQILESSPELLKDSSLSLLLKASILVDTSMLEDEYKTTELDIEMHSKLPPIKLTSVKSDRDLFKQLRKAQKDTTGLSTADIVRKDLKYATDLSNDCLFAVASVKSTLADLGLTSNTENEAFMKQLSEIMDADKNNPLDAFFILCFHNKNYKQLLCGIRTSKSSYLNAEKLDEGLQIGKEYGGLKMVGKRQAWPSLNGDFEFSLFSLQQPISRKQVLPFLTDCFSSKI
mmetsp:Transcript_441/g.658  ORF Transcript_441/g.658 Transcript_441/m.658 type:complete len:400 (+) Transcript_441:148-1347(+)